MDSALIKINQHLREAYDLLADQYAEERQSKLQSGDELPDAKLQKLAAETIDLSDRLQRQLQPPSLTLAESFLAYIDTKCLWAVVSHGIPDMVSAGHCHVGELAKLAGLKEHNLHRVLQVLCDNGIFRYEVDTQEYSHSPASQLLTTQHWTQWHNWTDLYGNEFYDICRGLPGSLKVDEMRSAAQIELRTDLGLFQYMASQGLAEKFHRTLGAGAVAQAPGILADYDWFSMAQGKVILDIGAGSGDFLGELLRAHPRMRGAILELENVVDIARQNFHGQGGKYADVGDRMMHMHVGDFTVKVPAYEMYVMKWCLHNWDDESTVKILSNIRAAIQISVESRLVVIEGVTASGRSGRITRYADITMMTGVNGLERTEMEWSSLAARSGWRINAISPLRNAWCCAIDMRPV